MSRIIQVDRAFLAPGRLKFSRPIGLVVADDLGNQFEILERFLIVRTRHTKEYTVNYYGHCIDFGSNPSWLCEGIGITVSELDNYFDQLEEIMEGWPIARAHLLKRIENH
ncbi:hypothetical protein [Phaeocystidibacter marisrubri]|uniref:Uncharacterized protein n=1 Tax=Phaeocystidibacter marisrubri TaxID=1577780 RepID=A0A6L3ZCE0_9FLAO|nr:hypothetical protein [Phaeocystidibacter marisrubri]KAB2815505.1 hypothetical protein F8C82_07305 [Phaeocystidibacter marisrubri]